MSALSVQPAFPIFTAIDGQPLENGYIWIGVANLDPQTNPVQVYWDAALTIAAAQPIRTLAGYPSRSGTPARVYVNSDYSIRVQDKNASTVYSAPQATERISSDLVTYQPPFTGGVAIDLQDKLAQMISVKDFGAVGDGVTDDTAAIQLAIDSGEDLLFPAGAYLANNLTQSTNFQRFYANGQVNIAKNANGVLLASTSNYVEFDGIQFLGTGYTGDNVTATGSNPRFINCSSYGAAGRALKATGGHVQILGTCGTYATTDATATGYDIEIGVSGTATLYHQLIGVYTAQAAGGILLIDTGSHVISGGQFGKLTIQSGTSPSGVNGGITSNARILGDVSVGLSNSIFSGNQFSNQTITFLIGTSQHSLDTSNNTISATIVNNGNSNSVIVKSIGTGAPSGIRLQYGADSSNTIVRYAPDEIYFEDSSLNFANNKAIKFADSAGSLRNGIVLTSGDDWQIGDDTGANFSNIISGSGGIYLVPSASVVQCTSTAFKAVSDGVPDLGGPSNRWDTVYAVTGAINTSDEREKQDITELDAAEKRVATALKGLVKKFRFKDAVQTKGDAARIHVGVIAQDVKVAFEAEGLDAMQYAILCYNEWDAEPEVKDKQGNILAPARVAGNRYGIRYEELLAFMIGAM